MRATTLTRDRRHRSLRRASAVVLAPGVLAGGAAALPDGSSGGETLAKLIKVEETITV